jgi:hypothetical protein
MDNWAMAQRRIASHRNEYIFKEGTRVGKISSFPEIKSIHCFHCPRACNRRKRAAVILTGLGAKIEYNKLRARITGQ